jgi:GT2 family glycosyltransferase
MACRYTAGITNHASYDDLPACLESLRRQTQPPARILVVDTGADPERLQTLQRDHPDVEFELRANRGYGAGANRILAWTEQREPCAEFALILNPDIALDPPFSEVLLEDMRLHPGVALASGKLLRPGRKEIDSAGIRMPLHRRPRDRGSEEIDRGQYDRAEQLFGVTGAAMMIRRAALPDLALDDGEIFDEDFFAYHEDTDLAWRANLLGWQVRYQPRAVAVHERRWRRERRNEIEPWVRRHSFKNHYLQIIKNESAGSFLVHLPVLVVWEILRLGFTLLRDRSLLPGYAEALRAAPRAWAKRRIIQQRVREGRAGELASRARRPPVRD